MSRTFAAVAALVVIAIVIHYSALSGWWLYDDPQLLIEAIRQPPGDILFNPAEYTHLAAHTFTPLLLLSFKLDLAMEGLRPTSFYTHQLLALTIAGVLFFFLLRRYAADVYAFAGAALFLTSWAAVYAARTLMIRHYVEGLVFALAALLLWSHALRRQRLALSWIAAAAYLIAMLCKEVYAPLPLLLICQARYEKHSWRQVLRDLVPPCVAAAVFLIWRWRMTGLVGAPSSILQTTTLGDLRGISGITWSDRFPSGRDRSGSWRLPRSFFCLSGGTSGTQLRFSPPRLSWWRFRSCRWRPISNGATASPSSPSSSAD